MTYRTTFAITATKRKSKVYWCNHLGWQREDLLPTYPHQWIHQYKTESSARWVMKTFNGIWPDLYNFKIETRMEKIMEPNYRYLTGCQEMKEEKRVSNYVKYMAKNHPEEELDMEHMKKPAFKSTRSYVKTTRSVKAIIRYNHLDRKQVVYYKQGDRFFKLLDSMTIRPMAKSMMNIHSIAKHWSTKYKIEVVEYDEQLMFNGEVLDIPMDTFNINDSLKG